MYSQNSMKSKPHIVRKVESIGQQWNDCQRAIAQSELKFSNAHYKKKKRPQPIDYSLYGNVCGPMVTVLIRINRPIHLMLTHSPLHHMLPIPAWLVAKMNVLSPTFTLCFLYEVGVSTEDNRGSLTFTGNA